MLRLLLCSILGEVELYLDMRVTYLDTRVSPDCITLLSFDNGYFRNSLPCFPFDIQVIPDYFTPLTTDTGVPSTG